MSSQTFYITHLVPDELPKEGLRKLLFYTATQKSYNEGMYYWGLDLKNPFDESEIKSLEKQGKVLKLPKPLEVNKGEGIWLSNEGKVYKGNLKDPYKNLSKEPIFAPEELSKVSQVYKQSIGYRNVPTAKIAMSL